MIFSPPDGACFGWRWWEKTGILTESERSGHLDVVPAIYTKTGEHVHCGVCDKA